MQRIAWATDVHLDLLEADQIDAFCRAIDGERPDVLLLAGDISEAPSLQGHLLQLERSVTSSIYFVLGNHDYYHGSVAAVRRAMKRLTGRSTRLRWLPAAGVVELDPNTCLVGHDGWADGALGDYEHSSVMLNDYALIEDFKGLDKSARRVLLGRLGRQAATHFDRVLRTAVQGYRKIIVLTHVPPFREACRYRDQVADDAWLPHFSCKAVGDVLLRVMRQAPDCRMTVLCGHTHHAADMYPLPNLRVRVGPAEYGKPALQEVLEL